MDLNKETNKVITSPNTVISKFDKTLIVLRFLILKYSKDSVLVITIVTFSIKIVIS